jgi:restriction endonuclease S subunit
MATWLEKAPSHWGATKLKRVAEINPSKSASGFDAASEQKAVFLEMDSISVTGDYNASARKPISELWDGFTYFERGDVVVAKITPCFENGKGADLSDLPTPIGFGTTELHVIRPGENLNASFLDYLIRADPIRKQGEAFMQGSAGQQRVPTSFIQDLEIALPPLSEQIIIAEHLDTKTHQIDDYVAKKRKLVDLLETQRRAVVNRAVTRGLDDDVAMRDSGVEWLGEIPAHWEEIRLRYATSYVTSGSRGWGQYYDENGHALFVRIGNLRRDSIDLDLSDTEYLTLPENAEGKRTRLQEGDIGSVGVVPDDLGEAYVNQHVALTRPRRDLVEPRWMGYALLSGMGRPQLRSQLYGGTKDGLSLADVKDVTFYVPPLDEQKRIVEHIDAQTADIDAAIERTERQIALMQQYRTSLVTEVVTGAVDVRTEVAA